MFKDEAKNYLYEYEKSITDSYRMLLKARENLNNLDRLGFNVEKQQEKMQKEVEHLEKVKNENLDFTLSFLKEHFENN